MTATFIINFVWFVADIILIALIRDCWQDINILKHKPLFQAANALPLFIFTIGFYFISCSIADMPTRFFDGLKTGPLSAAYFAVFFFFVAASEELCFRGVVLRLLRKYINNDFLAIIISSVAFGAIHLVFNPSLFRFVTTTCIGLIFGFAAAKGRYCSLLTVILAHWFYDMAVAAPKII